MDYYKKKIDIIQVDKNDEIVGKVERWKAHEEGILHRAISVAVFFEDKIVCQHRKHPVFDGFLDLTASSHQTYLGEIQSGKDCTLKTLEREWNLKEKQLLDLTYKGKVYYKSKFDTFIEHEFDYLYFAKVKTFPKPNFEFCYGFSLLTRKQLQTKGFPTNKALAPWVVEYMDKQLL